MSAIRCRSCCVNLHGGTAEAILDVDKILAYFGGEQEMARKFLADMRAE